MTEWVIAGFEARLGGGGIQDTPDYWHILGIMNGIIVSTHSLLLLSRKQGDGKLEGARRRMGLYQRTVPVKPTIRRVTRNRFSDHPRLTCSASKA